MINLEFFTGQHFESKAGLVQTIAHFRCVAPRYKSLQTLVLIIGYRRFILNSDNPVIAILLTLAERKLPRK
jgi:hypothetical protein